MVSQGVAKRRIATHRFGAWRSGGILAQHLIRSTPFKFSTNFHTKNVRPHYAKPLLPARAFLSLVFLSGIILFKNTRCDMSAKTKGVAHCVVYLSLLCFVQGQVKYVLKFRFNVH